MLWRNVKHYTKWLSQFASHTVPCVFMIRSAQGKHSKGGHCYSWKCFYGCMLLKRTTCVLVVVYLIKCWVQWKVLRVETTMDSTWFAGRQTGLGGLHVAAYSSSLHVLYWPWLLALRMRGLEFSQKTSVYNKENEGSCCLRGYLCSVCECASSQALRWVVTELVGVTTGNSIVQGEG